MRRLVSPGFGSPDRKQGVSTTTWKARHLGCFNLARRPQSRRSHSDPLVLEFLNLRDGHSESDLEQALILELERFLLELGNDFAFVARQKRLRIRNRIVPGRSIVFVSEPPDHETGPRSKLSG